MIKWICILYFVLYPLSLTFAGEEYTFDISEIEKKPYHFGGYAEFKPILLGLNKDAAFYKLKFYNRNEAGTIKEYDAALQLDASLEKDIAKIFIRTNTSYKNSYLGETQETVIYEGFLSLKPSSSVTINAGKKTLLWGKGYAWNPAAFVDRPKNPDDPELNIEGYIIAAADYIKSFDSPLKTFSFTPVIIPVYKHVNDNFGEPDKLNFAGKVYLLLYDTDIDFIILSGGSKTTRYGMDFSMNITTNFEIHGEFASINDYKKQFIDDKGNIYENRYDSKSYLIGTRYLTEHNDTFIFEYYRNGTGFTKNEMQNYFSFINNAYDSYLSSGTDTLIKKGLNITKENYDRMNPMGDYIYMRISRKDPFDILYYTPAVTAMSNINDGSFILFPELLYTGITNLDLRFKTAFVSGEQFSEYRQKQNNYRIEFRVRYYF